jgi:predicted nucleotidyltransferase
MSEMLARVASEVGASERTLRRAVRSGLIRGIDPHSPRIEVPEEEIAWVRSHWPLVGRLRVLLRTERNVELAVLFGSVARGDDVSEVSDVDLLVAIRNLRADAMEALRERLTSGLGADVQLVSLERARRNPHLLAEITRDGRPLVDRGSLWPPLLAHARRTRAQTDRAGRELHQSAQTALGYFRRLAATRAETALSLGS